MESACWMTVFRAEARLQDGGSCVVPEQQPQLNIQATVWLIGSLYINICGINGKSCHYRPFLYDLLTGRRIFYPFGQIFVCAILSRRDGSDWWGSGFCHIPCIYIYIYIYIYNSLQPCVEPCVEWKVHWGAQRSLWNQWSLPAEWPSSGRRHGSKMEGPALFQNSSLSWTYRPLCGWLGVYILIYAE